jgi:hypothetical protein
MDSLSYVRPAILGKPEQPLVQFEKGLYRGTPFRRATKAGFRASASAAGFCTERLKASGSGVPDGIAEEIAEKVFCAVEIPLSG